MVVDVHGTRIFSVHRCMALWSGCHAHNFTKTVDHYFHEYKGPNADPKHFTGVTLAELPDIEKKFEVNINVYELAEEEVTPQENPEENPEEKADGTEAESQESGQRRVVAKVVQRSHRRYTETMNLNIYQDHFSYIRDMDAYCKSYACRKCGKLWKKVWFLHRHERTCEVDVTYQYGGGAYHITETIFEKLEDEGIVVPDVHRYYPYRATYDFECYFDQTSLPANSEKVTWEAKHIPLSVSIASNVPGYEAPVCFVTGGDPQQLIEATMKHLDAIADAAYVYLLGIFEPIFEELEKKITDGILNEVFNVDGDGEDKKHPLERLRDELQAYLLELPVVGFNSGRSVFLVSLSFASTLCIL